RTIGLSLQLQNRADFPARPVACRAYFLEPAVVDRLKAAAAKEGNEKPSLREVFRDDLVARSFEVARVLAAVPELEGTIDENGACEFHRITLPETCSAIPLPEEVTIVVVIDRYPEEGT